MKDNPAAYALDDDTAPRPVLTIHNAVVVSVVVADLDGLTITSTEPRPVTKAKAEALLALLEGPD